MLLFSLNLDCFNIESSLFWSPFPPRCVLLSNLSQSIPLHWEQRLHIHEIDRLKNFSLIKLVPEKGLYFLLGIAFELFLFSLRRLGTMPPISRRCFIISKDSSSEIATSSAPDFIPIYSVFYVTRETCFHLFIASYCSSKKVVIRNQWVIIPLCNYKKKTCRIKNSTRMLLCTKSASLFPPCNIFGWNKQFARFILNMTKQRKH